jgi:hypothetical protein
MLFFSFDFHKLHVPSSKMVAIYPYKMSGFILEVECKLYSVQDFACQESSYIRKCANIK